MRERERSFPKTMDTREETKRVHVSAHYRTMYRSTTRERSMERQLAHILLSWYPDEVIAAMKRIERLSLVQKVVLKKYGVR